MIRALTYAVILLVTLALPAGSQTTEESGGILVDLLESTLSGDNRALKVTGLQGALSSRATIEQLTVSDDEGIWLTISGAVLDWNRLALVRGRFSVNALTADEIIVARLPNPPKNAPLPSPEAQPFSVPELPVAVEIGELTAKRIELGEGVAGVEADLALEGALTLADGTLIGRLAINRLDRTEDALSVAVGFANETRQIDVDLSLFEASGGLISTMLKIPEAPPLAFTALGSGPTSDFSADIALASNGVTRVSGLVTLKAVAAPATPGTQAPDEGQTEPQPEQAETATEFSAQLSGNVMPLLAEIYRPFFGDNTLVDVAGLSLPDGSLTLDTLALKSQALDLKGGLALDTSKRPVALNLTGRITPPAGDQVVLPIGGPRTALGSAEIDVALDTAVSNAWRLTATVDGFTRPDITASLARVTGSGTLINGDTPRIDGRIAAELTDLVFADPSLGDAVGSDMSLAGRFAMDGSGALKLDGITLTGDQYSANVTGTVQGLNSGYRLEGEAAVRAADVDRFSGLAGRPMSGAIDARVKGSGSPLGGFFDVQADIQARDLRVGIEQADNLMPGATKLHIDAARGTTGLEIRDFRLDGTALTAALNGAVRSHGTDLTFDVALDDLGRVLPEYPGAFATQGQLSEVDGTWSGDVRVDAAEGSYAELSGSLKADDFATLPANAIGDVTFDVRLGRIERFVPDFNGALALRGDAQLDDGRIATDLRMDATEGSHVELSGWAKADDFTDLSLNALADAAADLKFDANLVQIERFVPDFSGALALRGDAQLDDGRIATDLRMDATEGSHAELSGWVKASDFTELSLNALEDAVGDVKFDASLVRIERFAPDFKGVMTANGDVKLEGGALTGDLRVAETSGSFAEVSGTVDVKARSALTYKAQLTRIERFVPDFPGTLSLRGGAKRDGSTWLIDANAEGPAGIVTQVSGSIDEQTLLADMRAQGQIQVGAANRLISPMSVQGLAQFDLKVKGPPALESVSGQVTLSGASVAIPQIANTINDLSATVTLADLNARVSGNGNLRTGGSFTVDGPIAMAAPFDSALNLSLSQIGLTDNISYSSSLDGSLAYRGPLIGDGKLSGEIVFGKTEINIAAAPGGGGAAPIPQITHVSEPSASFATRERAGLIAKETATKGPEIGLDLKLIAERQVFVRGRGLNAELGGTIRIRGTTQRVVPSGRIELLRGVMDIMGRRLNLSKGIITLQGKLEPFIEFAATSSTEDGDAEISISGPLSAPVVEVTSSPPRPPEEALAMLLFGNRFSQLSPFKIAQMAAWLAQLNGGGGGVIGEVRNTLGVDNVDVTTDETGAAAVGVGTYVGENIYTDVTVNARGETELNLNLDINESLTARGSVDYKGNGGIGLFFDRNY